MPRASWCELSRAGCWTWRWISGRGLPASAAVLSPVAVFQYKCDFPYAPEAEAAIAWNDPSLGIDWGIPEADILLSQRDRSHPFLTDAPELFDYNIDYYAQ